VVLKLEHASESPGGDENTDPAPPHCTGVSDSVGVGWGLRRAFLTNSQVMLMLLVQSPSSKNECPKNNVSLIVEGQ